MRTLLSSGAAVAALLCAGVSAQAGTLRYCPGNANGVCYSVGVPSSSAASESGNIYFQITAPTTYQWVALGTGTGMAGSNIFIMYQDGLGNVTLSPRIGPNHQPPTLDTSANAAQLTVLAGSGVSADGNTMTANVACANCESWSGGGQLDLKDAQSSWIGAWRRGNSLATTSRSVSLVQHDDTAIFEFDLPRAAIATDSNPFTPAASTGGSGGDDSGSDSDSDKPGGDSSDDGGGVTVIGTGRVDRNILVGHGVIMAIVFVILYPLGSLLMPLLGKWWAHGAFQAVAWALMWAGFGLGVTYARYLNILFDQTHTILGTVVVCLLAIQPALGYAHHRHFLKHGARGIISHVHIWYGRALMILGVINGGLGLQLALGSNSCKIAYGVVAGVTFLIYASGKAFLSTKGRKSAGPGGGRIRSGRKAEAGSPASV
ncbi:hypothetical protein GE09DRAFT_1113060 [Coniochaeta sp. 2T2.1]|nr:hypothetical protein GE09DRAFT_1113060 [Coniochaeta sp. 2T2.1]